jgi:hypothetical protein
VSNLLLHDVDHPLDMCLIGVYCVLKVYHEGQNVVVYGSRSHDASVDKMSNHLTPEHAFDLCETCDDARPVHLEVWQVNWRDMRVSWKNTRRRNIRLPEDC